MLSAVLVRIVHVVFSPKFKVSLISNLYQSSQHSFVASQSTWPGGLGAGHPI